MTLTQDMTNLINGVANTAKGPNIQIEDQLKVNKAKTPLTLEEMKELLLTNTPMPEGKTVPVGLGMQDYASLPGGLAAYTGYISQMDAIKNSAGFGTGAGGTSEDPITDNPIEANCPDGYIFDSIKLKCVPVSNIPNLDGDDGGNNTTDQAALVNSYHSFAETIMQNDGYKKSDGTLQDFLDNMDDWWAGGVSKFLYPDQQLLASAFYSNVNKGLGVGSNMLGAGNEEYFDTGAIPQDPIEDDYELGTGMDILGKPTGPVYQGQPLNQYQPPLVDDTSLNEGQTPFYPTDSGPFGGGGSALGSSPSSLDLDAVRPGIASPMPVKPVAPVSIQSGDPQPAPTVKPATVTQQDVRDADAARQKEMDDRSDEKEANREAAQKARDDVDKAQEKVKGYSGGYGFNQGGFVEQAKPIQLSDVSLKMQEGGPIEGMPMDQPIPTEGAEGMPVPSGQPAGFVEDPMAAPAPDTPVDALQGEGQKDDVMGELPEGTFVINAMAVQLAGIDELEKMVEDAYEKMVELLKEKQVDEPLIRQLVDRSKSVGKVDVAVSNGEFIVPPELVPIIGEDKLRKINDRGLRKLEETKKTREKQQAPAQMKEGGRVIATEPDGKILTEKIKDESGREVSRILFKDEVKAPEDKGKPSDAFDSPVKDINQSSSFVRKVTPDEIAANFKRRQEQEGSRVSGPDVPTTDYIVRSEDPEELRDSAGYAEYADPEELRDSAGYAEYADPEELRDPAQYATRGKKRSFISRRPTTRPQGSVRDGGSYQNVAPTTFSGADRFDKPPVPSTPVVGGMMLNTGLFDSQGNRRVIEQPVVENNVSVEDGINLVNRLFKEGNRDKLLEIAIDQDNAFYTYSAEVKRKARDLAFDLGSGKADGPIKDILTSKSDSAMVNAQSRGMFDDRSLSEGQESLSGFINRPKVPAPIPPNAGDFNIKENMPDRLGSLEQRLYPQEKSFVEPVTPKDQTMQNVQKAEDIIAKQYQDADLGNLAETGDRTEIIPTDELVQELMQMNTSELNTMLQPDIYNEYSREDRKKITQEFMRRMTTSQRFDQFGIQPRLVSTLQEPRNSDNLTTREGDFPETIDSKDGVILNQLYMRLIDKESKFKDNAKSNKGAIGLSQLMPETIKDPGAGLIQLLPENERQYLDPRIVGNKPLTDNNANLLFGYYYLKALLIRYEGDVAKALSAYNYGLGNTDNLIQKYGNEWTSNLPDETEDYISTIKGYLRPSDITPPKPKPKQARMGGFV